MHLVKRESYKTGIKTLGYKNLVSVIKILQDLNMFLHESYCYS